MALIARTTATLRFYGDTLEPDVVTALLGKPPTESQAKGQVIKSKTTGKERLVPRSWRLHVADREPGDLDGQIAEIFSQLTPDLAKWRELSKYQPDLFVGFFMEAPNEMLALGAASLALLAERGVRLTFDVYDPVSELSNIQIIDSADNATFSIFQVPLEDFVQLFPDDQDIEFAEDILDRLGEISTKKIFDAMWRRPILKCDAKGIHGTIYFDCASKRGSVPASKREVDVDERFINEAQRRLFSE